VIELMFRLLSKEQKVRMTFSFNMELGLSFLPK